MQVQGVLELYCLRNTIALISIGKILKLQFSILTRLKKLQMNLVWNAGEQKHQYVPRKTDLSDAGSVWDQWGSCWDGNCWAPFIFGVKWGDGINRGFDLSYYIENIIQQHVEFVFWSIILIKITLTPYSFTFRNQDEENCSYPQSESKYATIDD